MINLITSLKAQASSDNATQHLRTELLEGLYIISERRSQSEDKLYQSLLTALSVSFNFNFSTRNHF